MLRLHLDMFLVIGNRTLDMMIIFDVSTLLTQIVDVGLAACLPRFECEPLEAELQPLASLYSTL